MINRSTLLFSHSKESINLIFCWKRFCPVFIWSWSFYVTLLQIYTVLTIRTSKLQYFACQWFNFYVGQFFRSDNFRTVKLSKISILEEIWTSELAIWKVHFRIGTLYVRFLWKTIICIPDKNNQKATKRPIIARVLWKIASLQRRPTNYLDSLEYLLIGNLFCLHYISCNDLFIGFR